MNQERCNLESELTVVRCQVGERSALDDLVERWHLPLWRFVRHMVDRHDQAEEAVQETWLRVLRGLPSLRDPARFAPWFYGIARRVLMDRLRLKYSQQLCDQTVDGLTTDDEVPAMDGEERARLNDRLRRVPMMEREILALHYVSGLSVREIAEVVGVPEGTVKSRLHRARHLLRDAMESTGVLK